VLIGTGVGGFIAQHFLASAPLEWKREYLDSAIFVAPTFGGAGFAFDAFWMKRLFGKSHDQSAELAEMIESLPFFASHLPNFHVWNDSVLIRRGEDLPILAEDLPVFLTNHSKIGSRNMEGFKKAIVPAQEVLRGPDVPAFVVFNGAIETDFGWSFKLPVDPSPKVKTAEGDGIVPSQAVQWACLNWPIERGSVHCVDLYRDHQGFEHDRLISNRFVLDLVLNFSLRRRLDETRERRIVRAPYVVLDDSGYHLREDIRAETVLRHYEL
jgi:lecithin-cholesterol acyltransferase